ncbi:MAG: ACT domain-containing protein [Acidimicrobiales bacterium]
MRIERPHPRRAAVGEHLLVVRNDDRPGMIGRVGTVLGDAGVNIADMDVGRSAKGESALMVIATSSPVSGEVVDALRSIEGITSVAVATSD